MSLSRAKLFGNGVKCKFVSRADGGELLGAQCEGFLRLRGLWGGSYCGPSWHSCEVHFRLDILYLAEVFTWRIVCQVGRLSEILQGT